MNPLPTLAALAAGCLLCSAGPAVAGGKSHAKLRNATPLARHNALLNNQGDPGDDDTSISVNPALSALCQSLISDLNFYDNPAPNVDQINNDPPVLAGSQTGCGSPQNETTIAVNPGNPLNLVAGTNDYRVFNTRENRNDGSGWAYTTFDGGRTWTNVQLPHLTFQTGATGPLSDMDSAGDPALAFGPNNTVYYSNLVFSRFNNGSGVVVSVSHDGGLTWGEPSIVHTDGVDQNGNPIDTDVFNDKNWIAVDPSSGTIYVTWTEFQAAGSPIYLSRSIDGGASWSTPVPVNPPSSFTPGGITPFSTGSNPTVNAKGVLFIAYESAVCQSLACDQPTDHDAVVVAVSDDGGRTFRNQEVAADFDFPFNEDTGRDTLTGENFRINSFPQLAIDSVTGSLYATWADDRNGSYDANGNSIKTNGDVFVVSSRDGGRNWSAPVQVGSGSDEVYPAVAAYNNSVAVTFYTRNYDPNGIGLDYAYVSGRGDIKKLSRAPLTRITTQTANPQIQFLGIGLVSGEILQGEFIGDYTAAAMGSDGVLHPCWTDFRGKPNVNGPNQDSYTQAIPLR